MSGQNLMIFQERTVPFAESVRIILEPPLDYLECTRVTKTFNRIPKHVLFLIDFKDIITIDNLCLAMLILLYHKSGRDPDRIRLVNCSPHIRSSLNVVHFGKIFQID